MTNPKKLRRPNPKMKIIPTKVQPKKGWAVTNLADNDEIGLGLDGNPQGISGSRKEGSDYNRQIKRLGI